MTYTDRGDRLLSCSISQQSTERDFCWCSASREPSAIYELYVCVFGRAEVVLLRNLPAKYATV